MTIDLRGYNKCFDSDIHFNIFWVLMMGKLFFLNVLNYTCFVGVFVWKVNEGKYRVYKIVFWFYRKDELN